MELELAELTPFELFWEARTLDKKIQRLRLADMAREARIKDKSADRRRRRWRAYRHAMDTMPIPRDLDLRPTEARYD